MREKRGQHDSTPIIVQRELNVDGVPFQWWAAGDRPALVTVRSRLFGSLSELTDEDVADYAVALATRLLKQHHDRAAAARLARHSTGGGSVLKKPGWFDEGDDVDFSSTYV